MTNFNIEIDNAVRVKTDIFFNRHILPLTNPSNIKWWFSVSGGKDSFCMFMSVKEWYDNSTYKFNYCLFHINQWDGPASKLIHNLFPLDEIVILDGRKITQRSINYGFGEQAPCRKCSDARRLLTDNMIINQRAKSDIINFVARGFHLSDLSVSLFWRYIVGKDPAKNITISGKGSPISNLYGKTFLVKPMYYLREFEISKYTTNKHFTPICCGCPGCKFPSRRDIIEETINNIFDDGKWEFDVPGLNHLLSNNLSPSEIAFVKSQSVQGKVKDKFRLPIDFTQFILSMLRNQIKTNNIASIVNKFDTHKHLDGLGMLRLRKNAILYKTDKIPCPKILNDVDISPEEAFMIATMGPFWGALALPLSSFHQAMDLQNKIFGIHFDELWSQTNQLLKTYYEMSGSLENGKVCKFH